MCTPIYCTQLHAPKVYVIPVIGGACQKRLQVFQWGAMWSVTGLVNLYRNWTPVLEFLGCVIITAHTWS